VVEQRCFACGETKSLDEFYTHPMMGNGHLGKCKECCKSQARVHYRKKIEDPKWREHERVRNREKYRCGIKAGKAWATRHAEPERRAANTAISNALRDGRIGAPSECQDCGHDFSEYRREAHHPDYSKPLEVEWLCARCHGNRHRSAA